MQTVSADEDTGATSPSLQMADTKSPLKKFSFKEILKFNKIDLPFILPAMLFSIINGALYPVMGVLFSRIFQVSFSEMVLG